MGTVKMMNIKESKTGNPSLHLKNSIEYVLNPDKCESGRWVGGTAGTTADEIYQNMIATKELFGKLTNEKQNRRQGYHFVFTFAPGETDEQGCFEMAEELCEKMLPNLQYVIAVHNDKNHMHAHIVFNSVDLDGNMCHFKTGDDGDWRKTIQPLANKIAKDHGCSEINLWSNNPTKGKEKWQRNTAGFNRYELIRQDIDKAIALSSSYDEVLSCLRDNDYTIREGSSKKYGSYLTFNPLWDAQRTRNYRLGPGYSVEDIIRRVKYKESDKKVQQAIVLMKHPSQRLLYTKWKDRPKVVRDIYRRNISLMMEWSNHSFKPFPDSYKIKKQMLELQQMIEEFNYLEEHKYDDPAEAIDRRAYCSMQAERLIKERKKLYYEQKSKGANHYHEIKELNEKIKKYKHESKLIDYSLKRSEKMKEDLPQVERGKDQDRKEKMADRQSNQSVS